MRILWLILGVAALALGAIGVLLPVMPTVPFLLVAAFAFARSSDRMHRWILEHRIYGPPIRDWHERGRIHPRIKLFACISMAAGFAMALVIGLPLWALAVQGSVMMGIAAFIVTRPD